MSVLTIVSAVIIALIVYTLTMDKIREIATLKLIGAPDRTIIGLILQQALLMGVIGFVVGTALVYALQRLVSAPHRHAPDRHRDAVRRRRGRLPAGERARRARGPAHRRRPRADGMTPCRSAANRIRWSS